VHPRLVVCASKSGAGLCVHPNPLLSPTPPLTNAEDVIAEDVIVVPQHLLITPSLAVRKSRAAAAVLQAWHPNPGLGLDPTHIHRKLAEIILAMFLLEEEAEGIASGWFPYIGTLPNRLELRQRLPILWTLDEQQVSLGGSHMVNVLSTLRWNMAASYRNAVCPVTPKFCDRFDLEADFLWALSIVQSRAFSLGGNDTLTLVPFGDMLNHQTRAVGPDILYREPVTSRTGGVSDDDGKAASSGNLTFFNRGPLLMQRKPGTQLFSHYGSMDAAKTFSMFGFVDRVSVWRATVVFDDRHAAATIVAGHYGSGGSTSSSKSRAEGNSGGGGSRRAFQLTTEVDDQAMDMVRNVCSTTRNDTSAVGSSLIASALGRLLTVVTEHLNLVAITDADAAAIKGASTTYRHAFRYRRGETHVLLYWQNLVKTALEVFEERRRTKNGEEQEQGTGTGARVELEVGSPAYLHYIRGEFHLVRVVAVRSVTKQDAEKDADGDADDDMSLLSKIFDVRFFPSGTKVVGVRRGELLDEASLLLYVVSSVA
jgi:hypothetical protein